MTHPSVLIFTSKFKLENSLKPNEVFSKRHHDKSKLETMDQDQKAKNDEFIC